MKDDSEDGCISPSSSPPTPPSPLPVSVGPGNEKYAFSSSPTPSPPFSPHSSSHVSAENLPLLREKLEGRPAQVAFTFSLDMPSHHGEVADSKSSCLVDLLDWFIERCCSFCSPSSNSSGVKKMQKSEQSVL